ncbi:hypothetical protein KA478_00615 [Patescibacteria group bacterium]|nr:hypothetical protein [Patescibacteria group bacterium]
MRKHHIVKQWIAVAFSALVQMCLLSQAHAGNLFDTSFPYKDNNYVANPTTSLNTVLKQSNQGGSLLENMLDLFGINYADPMGSGKAIVYVQIIINYVLALL